MYLVELKPGKEELYRTGDDLAIAIRDGDVDARSRIYHRATAKWISITLHPQYKAIVAGQEEEKPATPARRAWGLLTSLASVSAESGTDASVSAEAIRQRWKRPVGLGVASMLLLLGVQLAFSGPRPPWAGQHKTAVRVGPKLNSTLTPRVAANPRQDEPVMYDGEDYQLDMVSLASTHAGWPVRATAAGDTIAIPLPPATTVPVLPRAPRLRAKALRAALVTNKTNPVPMKGRSIESLIARYDAASNEAYTRLQSGIRVARLDRLFAPGRLTPGGGVPDTRVGLAGAANFIRVYRQEQTAIDKAYQDSVPLLAERNGWKPNDLKRWSSRPQRKESPTLELLSSSLMNGIDSILGVLDAQAGAYKLRGTAIAFENPAATEAYGALRRKIKEQIDAAVIAGGATSFGPTGLLLQAIGTSTLPRET
jgi:hypothetical protein